MPKKDYIEKGNSYKETTKRSNKNIYVTGSKKYYKNLSEINWNKYKEVAIMAAKKGTIEIYKTKKGFRFRIKSKNSKIIAIGETYNTKQGCKAGLKSLTRTMNDCDLIDLTLKK